MNQIQRERIENIIEDMTSTGKIFTAFDVTSTYNQNYVDTQLKHLDVAASVLSMCKLHSNYTYDYDETYNVKIFHPLGGSIDGYYHNIIDKITKFSMETLKEFEHKVVVHEPGEKSEKLSVPCRFIRKVSEKTPFRYINLFHNPKFNTLELVLSVSKLSSELLQRVSLIRSYTDDDYRISLKHLSLIADDPKSKYSIVVYDNKIIIKVKID